jgi:diguanylate cyclase
MTAASACTPDLGRGSAWRTVPPRAPLVAELALLGVAVASLTWFALHWTPGAPQLYLLVVPAVWAAHRRALAGAVAAVAVTGIALAVAASSGADVSERRLQVFLLVQAATAYVLGASEDRRGAARQAADDAARRLVAERDLVAAAERQFRLALDAAPIGMALVQPDGRFSMVNDALSRIVGYERDELLQRTFQDITHPDDLAADLSHVDDLLAGRADRYSMDKRYLHRLGHHVVVQLDVSLVRDDTGRPRHFIAQIQDVTARREAEEALRNSEATRRACLDALEQGVTLSDLDGRVRFINPAGADILDMGADELTERFRSGRWETFAEDGSVLPADERPLGITMRTGRATRDRTVRWRRGDGTLIALRVATEPVRDAHGDLRAVVTAFTDVTAELAAARAERAATDALRYHAEHDPLTGLSNRRTFLHDLDRCLGARQQAAAGALLFVDLDRFKQVNDTLGHAAGDAVLVAVADRLRTAVRPDDLVARLGGDEFVVYARDLATAEQAGTLADRVLDALAAPVQHHGDAVDVGASIGIALARRGITAEQLLVDADGGLYAAKAAGRGSRALAT